MPLYQLVEFFGFWPTIDPSHKFLKALAAANFPWDEDTNDSKVKMKNCACKHRDSKAGQPAILIT